MRVSKPKKSKDVPPRQIFRESKYDDLLIRVSSLEIGEVIELEPDEPFSENEEGYKAHAAFRNRIAAAIRRGFQETEMSFKVYITLHGLGVSRKT